MTLDRQLAYLDYLLQAARASVEVAYVLDFNEGAKEAAFSRLDALLRERDSQRRLWAESAGVTGAPALPPRRALFAAKLEPEEIPVYDPEALVW